MAARIGVLGSGSVGQTLARGFLRHGHEVRIGTRSPEKLAEWSSGAGEGVSVGDFADTAAFGEVLVLAAQGAVAGEVLSLAGTANLAGKVVIDTTNPIGGPAEGGIIRYFTGPNDSLMERLQAQVPEARFVKCFNSVGAGLMVNPRFEGGRCTMFIAGNDAYAKATVTAILDRFGWDAEDVGPVQGARAIEPLCQLWCAPGFLRGDWAHAYRVVKPAS
jgi:hypothetical protein